MSDEDDADAQDVSIEESPQNVRIETPAAGPILNHEDTHGITQWRRPSWRRRLGGKDSIERISEDLAQQLLVASELLLDRLFSYLSKLPEEDGEHMGLPNSGTGTEAPQSPIGLTLPASAVGWISSQLFPQGEDPDESIQLDDHSTISMSVSIRDRLSLLRFLLPRATHIRISADTWPPLPKRSKRIKNVSWTLAPNVNVSAMTLEEDFPRAFLQYFQALVHRPRIDMHIFPNCQVLLIDQVPPDRIHHLDAIKNSLQVLRVERSCIYDLPGLLAGSLHPAAAEVLGGDGSVGGDPLSTSPDDTIFYPKLTHVKLSNCGLNETSSLRGRRLEQGGQDMAPFTRLKFLRSLSLAHNELVSERTALAGLSSMPFLAKLDLSHNRIVSLKNAQYRLGNIQTLLLSHNRMRSVKGIDRLIALETLWLDHNDLDSIADASGLARLPELKSLRLEGNPFQINRPNAYRVSVLDLFREQRLATLPNGATYRQLRQALPVLDGTLATMKELVSLRGRTYAPADVFLSPPEQESEQVDSDITDTVQDNGTSNLVASYSAIPKRPIPVQRKTKRRQALVDLPGTREIIHVFPPREHTSSHIPGVTFSLDDVLRSLSKAEDPGENEPAIEERSAALLVDEACADVGLSFEHSSESRVENVESLAAAGAQTPSETISSQMGDDAKMGDDASAYLVEDVVSEVDKDSDLVTSPEYAADNGLFSAEDLHHLTLSPIKQMQELRESEATAATSTESNFGSCPEYDSVSPMRATTPEALSTSSGRRSIDEKERVSSNQEMVSQTSEHSDEQATPSPVHLGFRVASFPDNVWQDDSSVQSSMGTPRRDEANGPSVFQLAEENCRFHGPENFKTLAVHDNLELYFRLFVFARQGQDARQAQDIAKSPFAGGVEDDEWQTVLEQYPKIQLWAIDRRQREATISEQEQLTVKLDSREEFRRIWREKVVACGKLGLRRLTPIRSARYGFHGELLWSASNTSHLKPDTLCEYRKVIMCLSDTSLYIILDHDAVAAKAKDQKRKFPLPIPVDASFGDAKWPHALARHPFHTLKGITIGFAFQRLTLRFANPASPGSEEFTYILLTANKMETVELLKEIQDLATEAKSRAGLSIASEDSIKIENDDRHVLDALGVAVAPDVIGVVLHYQILEQRWKNGVRGSVRRVCVVTDTKMYLLDEDYVGDGAESIEASGSRVLGEAVYRLVDSAEMKQISEVKAADADPNAITIVIRALSRMQRSHNWRLLCHNRNDAERLVEDVRKAVSFAD
jgi:Leucine-rich repeat (LRR) protein